MLRTSTPCLTHVVHWKVRVMTDRPIAPRVWDRFPVKLVASLNFLAHPSNPDGTRIPCRLPDCHNGVERFREGGRHRWFHSRNCADEFRRRRRALDAACERLASLIGDGGLPSREAQALRGELSWLLNVRATYPLPGESGLSRVAVPESESPHRRKDARLIQALEALFQRRDAERAEATAVAKEVAKRRLPGA